MGLKKSQYLGTLKNAQTKENLLDKGAFMSSLSLVAREEEGINYSPKYRGWRGVATVMMCMMRAVLERCCPQKFVNHMSFNPPLVFCLPNLACFCWWAPQTPLTSFTLFHQVVNVALKWLILEAFLANLTMTFEDSILQTSSVAKILKHIYASDFLDLVL